jgi:tRNA splicing endonuclease
MGGIGSLPPGSNSSAVSNSTFVGKKRKFNNEQESSSSSCCCCCKDFSVEKVEKAAEDSVVVRGYSNKRQRTMTYWNTFLSKADYYCRCIATRLGLGQYVQKKLTHEEQRCMVFRDLQEAGWFVGPADVYGGDYNIYHNNPTNSHSMATIRVVYNGRVSARDLLAFSRVQNQVAKSAVFAFVNDTSGVSTRPIDYQVVNFQTVSDRM